MKRYSFLFVVLAFFYGLPSVQAQHFNEPDEYLDFVNDHHREIAKEIVFYTNTLAHGKEARKEEPVRKSILHKLKSASVRIGGMPAYKSDKSLQDSLVNYTRSIYVILNEEYPKVVGAQDSAKNGQSAMVHFWKVRAEALDMILKDEDKFNVSVKDFAKRYTIDLSDSHDEEYEQLQTIQKVSSYYQVVQGIYHTCSSEESKLTKAMDAKNEKDMSMYNASLFNYTKKGLTTLDSLKEYKGDASLYSATKQLLDFYQKETEFKGPGLITALIKEGAYEQTKKDLGGKSDTSMSLEEKERLIKAISEHNEFAANYTAVVTELNAERPKLVANWQKTSQAFLKKQLPK
jgi:hypothetical protein